MASLKELFENDPLNIELLPEFEKVKLESISRKYLVKKHTTTAIWFLIFLTATVLFHLYFTFPEGLFLPLAIFEAVMFSWFFYCNYQWQKRVGYAVRDRDVIYRRGFLAEKNTVVPFNRIQHVSTNRGVLDKFLNLSTLNIFTAGGSGSDISIPGLSPEMAEKLKNAFSEKISCQK